MRFFVYTYANRISVEAELMHRFCSMLTKIGMDNYMIYALRPPSEVCPVPEFYQKYGVKSARRYIDAKDSVMVVPEGFIHYADKCKKGLVVIWWMSVDNYLYSYEKYLGAAMDIFGLKGRKNVMHCVRSLEADTFVRQHFGNPDTFYLPDHISDEITFVGRLMHDKYVREDICLYDPERAPGIVRNLIENSRDGIKWMPLGSLPEEIRALNLCKAKVYLDLGGGMQYFSAAREAAVCRCTVITDKRRLDSGEDVIIPEKYIVEDPSDTGAILEMVYDLIDNYAERAPEFVHFAESVELEKVVFEKGTDVLVQVCGELAGMCPEDEGSCPEEISDGLAFALKRAKDMQDRIGKLAEDSTLSPSAILDELAALDHQTVLLQNEVWSVGVRLSDGEAV